MHFDSGIPPLKLLSGAMILYDSSFRHSLLKMQKQMRVQSAAQKRSLLELRQRQKRRALLGHSTRHDKEGKKEHESCRVFCLFAGN